VEVQTTRAATLVTQTVKALKKPEQILKVPFKHVYRRLSEENRPPQIHRR
jgi:hypothetical protein